MMDATAYQVPNSASRHQTLYYSTHDDTKTQNYLDHTIQQSTGLTHIHPPLRFISSSGRPW
jgi:hypothetical protein